MQRCQLFLLPCGSYSKEIIIFTENQLSFKLLTELEKTPKQTQRELSKLFGVSLGSLHYCLNALIKKGYIKVKNFNKNPNKLNYAYILTPSGMALKKKLTIDFLYPYSFL